MLQMKNNQQQKNKKIRKQHRQTDAFSDCNLVCPVSSGIGTKMASLYNEQTVTSIFKKIEIKCVNLVYHREQVNLRCIPIYFEKNVFQTSAYDNG